MVEHENELVSDKRGSKKGKRRHSPAETDGTSGSDSEDSRTTRSSRSSRKNKKLQSGKTAKLDNLDIKRVIKYPHSKLNREFTEAVEFDNLDLNTFVAGELELIIRAEENEKAMRMKVLLMIMYHAPHVKWPVLREQYDSLLKRLERKELEWTDDLDLIIDRAIERKQRLLLMTKTDKLQVKQTSKSTRSQTPKGSKGDETFYCLDYNKGLCTQPRAHKGKLGTKEVLKQHICRKCWQEKGQKVGHPEIDEKCPYNK